MTAEGKTIAVSDYDCPQDVARRVLTEHLRDLPDQDNDQRGVLVWLGRHTFGDSYLAAERDLLVDPE